MAQRARTAVLFIVLLADTEAYKIQSSAAQTSMVLALTSLARGAEAARASGEAGMLQRDESLQQMIHDLKKSLSNHTLRSPVCSSDINPSSAVERYTHKCEKLTQLAAEYNQEGCISGCPRWLGEVKQRMNEFKSCLSDPQGLPSELKDIMFSGGMAMKKVMLQAQRDLLGPAKRKGYFPAKGSCEFMSLHADITSSPATSIDALRSQVFGAGCASEESVREYIESFPKSERNTLEYIVKELKKLADIGEKAKKTGEPKTAELLEIEEEMDTFLSNADVTGSAGIRWSSTFNPFSAGSRDVRPISLTSSNNTALIEDAEGENIFLLLTWAAVPFYIVVILMFMGGIGG